MNDSVSRHRLEHPATGVAAAAAPDVRRRASKAIVLFSDGTGNSSAKLFKTNVWRLYEATDLGPAPRDRRVQIAYYDDGVGTSGFKPLALLGGVLGYGLKRNVLDIYKFVCRNYEDGDEIYAFGFSRGAFTMRLVIALIATVGLVPSDGEDELEARSAAMYRTYRRHWLPRRLQGPTRLVRKGRDALTRRRGAACDLSLNRHPTIRFLGVWDTVSAYGGPFAEVTRAIDNWIFPLSMPNYQLSERVHCARHALSIDDERDAFRPLLWDEVHEDTLREQGVVSAERLKQVWFAGMHADVGGGYPDESLSYISLLWMMEEAERCGLRTLDTIKARHVALANSAGPMHDSRKGVGAYYRYQPRRIDAWLHPPEPRTLALRDPAIRTPDGRSQGLLTAVKVHHSVVARIASGTDRYAPITLPAAFDVVLPREGGENVPQADSEGGVRSTTGSESLVPMAHLVRLADPETQRMRVRAMERVWDLVWRRRLAYALTLMPTLLLVTMPAWIGAAPRAPLLADGRTWIDGPVRMLGLLAPGGASPWVDTCAANPFYVMVLLGAWYVAWRYGNRLEGALRDVARRVWHDTLEGDASADAYPPSRLEQIRTSHRYQRALHILKWHALPDYVFMPVIVVLALWLGGGLAAQVLLPWAESGPELCPDNGPPRAMLVHYVGRLDTATPCLASGQEVTAGQVYSVTLVVDTPWFKGERPTTPEGLTVADLGVIGVLGVPYRRVVEASYLQPVVTILEPPRRWQVDNLHMEPLTLHSDDAVTYRTEFTAGRTGELRFFVNDAVVPGRWAWFYRRAPGVSNRGTATVHIRRK